MRSTARDIHLALAADLRLQVGVDAVGFDFGGTLLDRTPIHVSATVEAMKLTDDADIRIVEEIVRQHLALGANSRTFLSASCRALPARRFGNEEGLLARKRTLVARIQRATLMPESAVRLLASAAAFASVLVVSLGDIGETQDLLRRSFAHWEVPAVRANVYGRRGLVDEVSKRDLMRRAFGPFEASRCLYVGDSEADLDASRQLGIRFLRADPFRQVTS